MASTESQPLGPCSTPTLPTKKTRSRKSPTHNVSIQRDVGSTGSVGGIVLEKETKGKSTIASLPMPITTHSSAVEAASTLNKPRRKPRKLHKGPTPPVAQKPTTSSATVITGTATVANIELEALKSRVRGLEANAEQLYNGADTRLVRSPRRRGRGRKESTINTTAKNAAIVHNVREDADDADEELVRLEGELEVARQDLDAHDPQNQHTISQDTENVEEIHRHGDGLDNVNDRNRHVTLSGSYQIPLPTNVSMEDVKNIQSGVSAAQNVAKSYLAQRRAVATLRDRQDSLTLPATMPSQFANVSKSKAMSSSMAVGVSMGGEDGKQSWGEWSGGYSMAIMRAIKSIEHEAAMDNQKASAASASKKSALKVQAEIAPISEKNDGAGRPATKTKLSNEQFRGLLS